MARLTQAELQRNMQLLIKNGRLPEAQAILANIGYDLAELDRAEALLNGWINHQRQTEILKRQQVEATATEGKTGEVAELEVRKFRRVAEAVFKNNDPLLISLGLKPRRKSSGKATETTSSTAATPTATAPTATAAATESDENGQPVDSDQPTDATATTEAPPTATNGSQTTATRRPSNSASAKMARWRKLFANALSLEDTERGELAKGGWPDSRLQAGLAMVDAYIEADQVQHQCMRAFRAEEKLAVKGSQTTSAWYDRAMVLIDVAIADADPDDAQQLRQLFDRK